MELRSGGSSWAMTMGLPRLFSAGAEPFRRVRIALSCSEPFGQCEKRTKVTVGKGVPEHMSASFRLVLLSITRMKHVG